MFYSSVLQANKHRVPSLWVFTKLQYSITKMSFFVKFFVILSSVKCGLLFGRTTITKFEDLIAWRICRVFWEY